MDDLLKAFCGYVDRLIDEDGVYPHAMMWRCRDGKTNVEAVDLAAESMLLHVWDRIANKQAAELVFGLDRTTKPGQGTEFADVLTCGYWSEPETGKPWNAAWRPFVIDYQHEPRIVRPPNFDNEFWNPQIVSELQHFCPPARIVVR